MLSRSINTSDPASIKRQFVISNADGRQLNILNDADDRKSPDSSCLKPTQPMPSHPRTLTALPLPRQHPARTNSISDILNGRQIPPPPVFLLAQRQQSSSLDRHNRFEPLQPSFPPELSPAAGLHLFMSPPSHPSRLPPPLAHSGPRLLPPSRFTGIQQSTSTPAVFPLHSHIQNSQNQRGGNPLEYNSPDMRKERSLSSGSDSSDFRRLTIIDSSLKHSHHHYMPLHDPDAPMSGTGSSGRKRYECPYPNCNALFTNRGHVDRHIRVHTGEKPFACMFGGCRKRFSRQDNMVQHYRTHLHPSKSLKPSQDFRFDHHHV
eukprot:Partr_v1_DN26208_c2_g1_i1_m48458 putative regulation of response to salt stress